MPRWRRRREREPDVSEVTEEQPVVDDPDAEEEWPEWAYEERGRRRRRKTRRSRRRPRTVAPDPARPADGEPQEEPQEEPQDEPQEEPQDEAQEEPQEEPQDEPSPGVFDVEMMPDDEPEPDPAVWVSDEPPEEETPLEPTPDEPAVGAPVWLGEEEHRLHDVDDGEPRDEAAAPAVVVEPVREGGEPEAPQEERFEDDEARDGDDDTDDAEPSYRPVIGDVMPGGVGPRRAALYERKRTQRRIAIVTAIALVLLAVVGLGVLLGGDDPDDDGSRDGRGAVADGRNDQVETMLLYGTRERASEGDAKWVTLLSIDQSRNRGSVVYIPAHTAVEVPGRGLLPLGEAVSGDDVPVLLVALEGLLGIEIDRYLELSDRDARVLFTELDPLDIDIPSEVSVPAGGGKTQLIFPEGVQQISGDELEQLLFVTGVDGDDVELGSRHLAFWDALFDSYGGRVEELEEALMSAEAVLGQSDRSAEENADMIGDLAAFPEDAMVLNSLPVQQVGVGTRGELYSTDENEIERFVEDTIGARSFVGSETRIQILNGNGVPGIGEDVAELLVGEGYRVILSGNARRLDYEETLIITYERTEEAIELAERARELLGVGEVQVSGQEQGIVDLTIVVGKDFLGRN